ncbi:MAG: DUF2079 domain-containing protein [Oscillospiraceae bacterium]|nr:DUF2079 domain-containing protein [Oscillospiraceae bacterium]
MKAILNDKTKAMVSTVKAFLIRCGIPDMFMCRFVGMYFLISAIVLQMQRKNGIDSLFLWKEFVKAVPFVSSVLWLVFGFLLLTTIYYLVPKKFKIIDQIVLLIGLLFFVISVTWRMQTENYYFSLCITLVAIVFMSYLMGKVSHESLEKLPDIITALIIAVVAVAVVIYVSVTSILRHRTFSSSCYDFGIFVQMFWSMKTNLTAVTTCERDMFLSHFNVHASFIYYLLVPFYALFPSENTLLIAQAILAMGGIIPLYLIAKNHGYKGAIRIAVCMIYIFYAGLVAPNFYDFHENAFLPTLLMWLLYAVDTRKYILFYIMSVLTCIVKEDAPLYVICIGMYFMIEEKGWKRLHGLAVLAISGIYFVLISSWLKEYGDGDMMASTRFGNLTIEAGDSFGSIIKNVLTNPTYFFSLFIHDTSLLFFLEIMVPVMFLPFMTKKLYRYLLLIPFIIMNLVIGTSYGYAAGIGYQYIYGPSCLVIYLALLNAKDITYEKRNIIVAMASVASLISSLCFISSKMGFVDTYNGRPQYYKNLEACLDSVPQDGRVITNTWFLPHLADRKEVYVFDRNDFNTNPDIAEFEEAVTGLKDMQKYDFYVLSRGDENTPIAIPYLEEAGYTVYNETENYIVIYVSPEYKASHTS